MLETENKCICETLTLECNVIGSGSTVLSLQGSSTICDDPSEIILLHSRYNISNGARGRTVCNNGAIVLVGRSLRVEDNCFTSQLQIKFNADFAENLVNCIYDNGTVANVVGNFLIPSLDTIGKLMYTPPHSVHWIVFSTSIDPLPPPSNINWERIGIEELMFSWSPVISNCSSVHYNIRDSNCGICPNSTTGTNVTCLNVSTSHVSMCMLAVQTVMCGNISGEWSSQVNLLQNGIICTNRFREYS